MAASSVLAVLAMAELIPALDTVLELLRSPLGAVLFVPLYALWVTLLLPGCLLYTSPSPRDKRQSRMPSSA